MSVRKTLRVFLTGSDQMTKAGQSPAFVIVCSRRAFLRASGAPAA